MNIGIVGIGNMGFSMAERLLETRWTVAVHDIDPRREKAAAALGARVCVSAAEVASQSACVLVCVVNSEQVDAVLFDSQQGVVAQRNRPCIVLCPTIAPEDVSRAAVQLSAHHMSCIEAPMSGGPARAREGKMSLMVACDDALFERHVGLLGTLADPVFRIGQRLGDGARTKLVNNLLAAINLAGAAEATALAQRVGLDPSRTLDVIERSSGQSWIGSERMRRAISGDLVPRAHMSLLNKDAALALAMARATDFDAQVGAAAAAMFRRACDRGMANLDDARLLEMLQQRAANEP